MRYIGRQDATKRNYIRIKTAQRSTVHFTSTTTKKEDKINSYFIAEVSSLRLLFKLLWSQVVTTLIFAVEQILGTMNLGLAHCVVKATASLAI